jgi:hypothetical protein
MHRQYRDLQNRGMGADEKIGKHAGSRAAMPAHFFPTLKPGSRASSSYPRSRFMILSVVVPLLRVPRSAAKRLRGRARFEGRLALRRFT